MNRRKHVDARKAFGEAVRELRRAKGLSQEALADLAEIHRTYIGDIERGARNVCLQNMTRIAKALGVPLSQVVLNMEERS